MGNKVEVKFPTPIAYESIPEKYRVCPFCGQMLVILATDYSELCPTEWSHLIFQYRCDTQVRAEEESDFSDSACIERSTKCEIIAEANEALECNGENSMHSEHLD